VRPGGSPAPDGTSRGGGLAGCWRRRSPRAGGQPGRRGLPPQPCLWRGPPARHVPRRVTGCRTVPRTGEDLRGVPRHREGPAASPLLSSPSPGFRGAGGPASSWCWSRMGAQRAADDSSSSSPLLSDGDTLCFVSCFAIRCQRYQGRHSLPVRCRCRKAGSPGEPTHRDISAGELLSDVGAESRRFFTPEVCV